MPQRWMILLGLMLATLWGGTAGADVRIGFGDEAPSFFPIDTYFTDSRFQFIIPKEELRLESGEVITGLSLYLDNSAGSSIDQLTIRLKNATQTDLDSMSLGRYVNGGLTLCRQATTSVPAVGGWVLFAFGANHSVLSSRDLLIDVVMNKSVTGGDSYWSSVATSEPCLRYGINNVTPSFNLLGQSSGISYTRRPLVKLRGVNRRMPALVANASQLLDPDGQIHADWKVTGRRTTILPGVTLSFAEGYGLLVNDDLRAIGTETDSIRFTGQNWDGIGASLSSGKRIELEHCVVENAHNFGVVLSANGQEPRNAIRHSVVRNITYDGIAASIALLDLDEVLVEGCGVGLSLFNTQGRMEDLTLRDNDRGMESRGSAWSDDSYMRRLLVEGTADVGLEFQQGSLKLENSTLVGSGYRAIEAEDGFQLELVNCVLDNPAAQKEIHATVGSVAVLSHCVVVGGAARCSQDATSQVVFGAGMLSADPLLDGQHRPLAGSPVIDAGSLLSAADPDLTPSDIGCFWFDQSAPVASAAADVPQDQGGRLQLVWSASSMDLAQANGAWFYSLWRLDTLFSAQRSALPVVHTRAQAEAAMETGAAFTWERDGSAWNWLGSLPAARHSQYAQVVETLADRLDGQPWPTPLKVLWHAGEVLSESAVLTGTSLDNVPPDAPRLLASVSLPDDGLLLTWEPVTMGTLNGQQLPERGGVGYRVYEIPTPWAPESAGTLLGTTSEPQFTLPLPVGNEQRFFRVRAVDNL